jgi:outer membrane biosynthesis protein TonB
MIPAFALIGILAAGQQVNEPQVTQPQGATDAPVVTCEAKNPDFTGAPIQFSVEGVDLTEWLKKFRAQVQRNLFVPYKAMTLKGCAIVSFKVATDGRILDIVLNHPSETAAFTIAATNAIQGSNPTWALPQEYRGEPIAFTFTFFYNTGPHTPPDKTDAPAVEK